MKPSGVMRRAVRLGLATLDDDGWMVRGERARTLSSRQFLRFARVARALLRRGVVVEWNDSAVWRAANPREVEPEGIAGAIERNAERDAIRREGLVWSRWRELCGTVRDCVDCRRAAPTTVEMLCEWHGAMARSIKGDPAARFQLLNLPGTDDDIPF